MIATTHKDPSRREDIVSVRVSDLDMEMIGKQVFERAVTKIADAVAEHFLGEHLQETLALLNPEAVANLAVADAAGSIREALHKKLPDKIVEVVRKETEVYQRGVFGGLKRIS